MWASRNKQKKKHFIGVVKKCWNLAILCISCQCQERDTQDIKPRATWGHWSFSWLSTAPWEGGWLSHLQYTSSFWEKMGDGSSVCIVYDIQALLHRASCHIGTFIFLNGWQLFTSFWGPYICPKKSARYVRGLMEVAFHSWKRFTLGSSAQGCDLVRFPRSQSLELDFMELVHHKWLEQQLQHASLV
jgi:hypothetical protein